ncbi:hypothetical protein Tco_1188339, partial [Tanacetum coccineum]
MQEDNDEIHRHKGSLNLQRNIGKDETKSFKGHPFHRLFNDKVPYSKRNCHIGHQEYYKFGISNQLVVIIGGGLPETCNKDGQCDGGEHNLNANASIESERQKQRVLAPEKSKAVAKDVDEWAKA